VCVGMNVCICVRSDLLSNVISNSMQVNKFVINNPVAQLRNKHAHSESNSSNQKNLDRFDLI